MNEETSDINPNHAQRVVYLHSASYDLFILVLTIFSLLVAVGLFLLPLKPAADAILLFVDFILCALFLFDFLLSLQRAPNKVDYLVKQGVARERLKAKGYGESEPIASNSTGKGRATNRRVNLLWLD